MSGNYYILAVGLEPQARSFALNYFREAGHRAATADELALSTETLNDPALDLVYLQPPSNSSGADEIRHISEIRAELPTILVCENPTASNALNAWHAGAVDAVFLPLSKDALHSSLQRANRHIMPKESPEAHARFRYLDDTGKERWASLHGARFTIGRSSTNDLVLPQMNISRSQAEIQLENDRFILRDLASKHGTYLNGTRIEQAALSHGDRITLGGLHGQSITFYQGDLLQSLLGSSDSKAEAGFSIRGFREIGMLLSTFRALSSIPLLDDLLSLVVDTAIELTGAERGFIMLKDVHGDLQFRCARNSFKRPLDGASFQTSRRVPDDVFRTGERMVINDLDVGANSDDHSTTRRLGVRSIFCVPLRYLSFHDSGSLSGIGRMETIGVLYVDSQSIGAGLSNTQVEALETLASEAAMAIYNARLYKESQEKRVMEEELAIARDLQQALLPPRNKILPFVRACSQNIPCHEVGGDYFDYFEFEDGRLGFAVGDVAGKGTSAALLTSMLQGIFSAQTLLDLPVPQILSNVNRSLVKRGTGSRFVTFFFGILDPAGGCVYTNAGHNPPFVLSRDGSLQELTEGGMVLGLFAAAEYTAGTVQLRPGDHMVLFTDGVLEARNTRGEEFGEDRLRDLLRRNAAAPAEEILARLQEELSEFSAGTPQHDDITMMVLGYGGKTP